MQVDQWHGDPLDSPSARNMIMAKYGPYGRRTANRPAIQPEAYRMPSPFIERKSLIKRIAARARGKRC